ncbi:uncharacterized protein LOC110845130 [Folsomia candida]|uniref:Uncharacterized protein n=1 Tax=Folsomia candida TaxID=158441 RepID=A0A226ERZ8_FOLCA|nr:uncharacterized protein LOC110845130 [Folsomia candida]OXA59834.1 hypothetical protein Fcan01_04288 [Folsomia candida]
MPLLQNGGGGLRIFLNLTQFFLCVLTIIGLHLNSALWDFHDTRKPELSSGPSERQYSNLKPVEPTTYFSGALWGAVIGLLGIGALVVFVLSWIIRLPKILLTIYYLVCGCIVIAVSSFGLGWNEHAADYNTCMKAETPTPTGGKFAPCRFEKLQIYLIFITYFISCIHATLYLASFYVSFTDKTSCPYQSLRVEPQQSIIMPNPGNQPEAQPSATQDPDQIPA